MFVVTYWTLGVDRVCRRHELHKHGPSQCIALHIGAPCANKYDFFYGCVAHHYASDIVTTGSWHPLTKAPAMNWFPFAEWPRGFM